MREIDELLKDDQKMVKKVTEAIERNDTDQGKVGGLFSDVIDPLTTKIDILEAELRDIKNYLIDTHIHGVDSDTLHSRVKRYREELKD